MQESQSYLRMGRVAIKILASGLYGQEACTIPQHEGLGEVVVDEKSKKCLLAKHPDL
jgi:hypothetical protein